MEGGEEGVWGGLLGAAFRFFEERGVEVGDEHEREVPGDDEGFRFGEITEDEIDGIGAFDFVFGEGDNGVRVAAKDAGSGDAVDGFFGGLVAFGEVGGKDDGGAGVKGEGFEFVAELAGVSGGIFVAAAETFIYGVDDDEGIVAGVDGLEEGGE